MKMEYYDFLNAVCEHINEKETDVKVSIHPTVKNNNVRLFGLSFSKKGYNASPTIYMEHHYEEYLKGSDVNDIGDRLLETYYENSLAVKLDMTFFEDFDLVKDRLYIKLINREKNSDFLNEVPYEPFLDLAVVAYVRMHDRKIGNGIIMVRNEHCRLWKKTGEEILEIAAKNTHDHDSFKMKNIMDVIVSIRKEDMIIPGMDEMPQIPMYVVSNSRMVNGAAVLTMKDRLSEFAKEIGTDYYIIPSSVHELILLGCNDSDDMVDINAMIRDVNETQLSPDDVLADHAYLCNESGEREIVS